MPQASLEKARAAAPDFAVDPRGTRRLLVEFSSLGGSWVTISGDICREAISMTHTSVLITPSSVDAMFKIFPVKAVYSLTKTKALLFMVAVFLAIAFVGPC